MTRNHWNCPAYMLFSAKSTYSISKRNHLPLANMSIPSIQYATSFHCHSRLSSIADSSDIHTPTPWPPVLPLISRYFIRSPKNSNTRVISESMSSDHCSIRGASIIPLFKLSNYPFKYLICRLWPWSIFLTKSMVDLTLAFMSTVYVKALALTLSISSFTWSATFKPCLAMCLARWIPSHMIPTWYFHPSYLPPLPIDTWRFNTYPIINSLSLLT